MTSDAFHSTSQTSSRPDSPGGEVAVDLSAERLRTSTEWVESGRVRLRRRVVSETRSIEVVVRHEELIIETHDVVPGAGVGESYRGATLDGPPVSDPVPVSAPLVLLLREEVPEVVLRPHVYERVTAEIVMNDETAVRSALVGHEEVEVRESAEQDGPAIG